MRRAEEETGKARGLMERREREQAMSVATRCGRWRNRGEAEGESQGQQAGGGFGGPGEEEAFQRKLE